MTRQWKVGFISTLLLLSVCFAAQYKPAQTKEFLPRVVSASVPFYPELARETHIEGAVTLQVSTNGKSVSSINPENGALLLINAARENVKTWQFAPHNPTNFEVTFHYNLLPVECDSNCNCGPKEKESVLLQLPTTVEVSAPPLMICDPAVEIRRKKSIFARLFHSAH
jgi:Gram-negative bacterial TonB protein C-terminal